MRPTRVMIEVCTRCFNGDWEAMQQYARRYESAQNPPLGKVFRDLIGSRNRSQFWQEVAKRDSSTASSAVVDGDSVSGMKRAIELCRQGMSINIALEGEVIGTLTPVKKANE